MTVCDATKKQGCAIGPMQGCTGGRSRRQHLGPRDEGERPILKQNWNLISAELSFLALE